MAAHAVAATGTGSPGKKGVNIGQIFEQTVQENSGQGGQVENQEQKQEQ